MEVENTEYRSMINLSYFYTISASQYLDNNYG